MGLVDLWGVGLVLVLLVRFWELLICLVWWLWGMLFWFSLVEKGYVREFFFLWMVKFFFRIVDVVVNFFIFSDSGVFWFDLVNWIVLVMVIVSCFVVLCFFLMSSVIWCWLFLLSLCFGKGIVDVVVVSRCKFGGIWSFVRVLDMFGIVYLLVRYWNCFMSLMLVNCDWL